MLDWLTSHAEIIGVAATIVVLLSFAVRSSVMSYYINIVGAALFVGYGLLVGALSVTLLNAILIVIRLYKLIKYSRRKVYHTIPSTIFNFKNNQIQK